jgi:glyoxylase-like metal-dependent hydrolase (beta-lactamase superfamily II)
MNEKDLRDLGILRIPVPIPFRQAGGPVNVYAIEEAGGGFALFDAGLGSAEAESALEAGLRAAGRRFSEMTRVILSHGHVDHYGGARTALEKAGHPVSVFAHPADIPKVSEAGPRWKDLAPAYGAFFLGHGVPAEVLAILASESAGGFNLARRLAEVRPVAEGEMLSFRYFRAEILHMPGHTPGLLCLWDREHRIFFSDDHLLEKVSPNPLVDLRAGEKWRPLVSYLESAGRMRALDVELVLPGHGPPFRDHRRVIDGLRHFYGKRQAKIRSLLAEAPRTAYEVTRALFPWAKPADLFLTFSEAMANLEVLESRGEVGRQGGEATRFHLVA